MGVFISVFVDLVQHLTHSRCSVNMYLSSQFPHSGFSGSTLVMKMAVLSFSLSSCLKQYIPGSHGERTLGGDSVEFLQVTLSKDQVRVIRICNSSTAQLGRGVTSYVNLFTNVGQARHIIGIPHSLGNIDCRVVVAELHHVHPGQIT